MRSKTLAAVAAAALVGSGLVAGSVIGDEGANTIAEELGRDFGEPIVQQATPEGPAGNSAGASGKNRKKKPKKPKKPKVTHGAGQPITVGPGTSQAVALKCPKRVPIPVSAGLATANAEPSDQVPVVFANYIGRFFEEPRAMVVAVVNAGEQAARWTPTIVCMKGVKEV